MISLIVETHDNDLVEELPVQSPAGHLSVDPLFRDPVRGDLALKCGSPCIDEGDPQSEYALEPEDNGDRINMGAYGGTTFATSSCPADTVE